MIVILKSNPNPEQLSSLIEWLQSKGIIIHTSVGASRTILGLVGDTSALDMYEERLPLYARFRDTVIDNDRPAEDTAAAIWRDFCEHSGD